MSAKPLFLYSFFIIFACWILGLCTFTLYAYMLKFSAVPSADAIVVLTGGSERLQTALTLLKNEKAPRMLISGVNSRVSTGALFQEMDAEYIDRIDLGYMAENTFENALETKAWTEVHNIHSFLLVTSFYHMPRSLFELRTAMPSMRIYPVPVFMQTEQHWTRTRSAWLVFVEYNKFIIRFIQSLIRRTFL